MGRLEDEVRELILDRYRNLAEFARAIGIPSHTLYSALNNGLVNTTLSTAMPIVKALDIDPIEIMEGRLSVVTPDGASVPVPVYASVSVGQGVKLKTGEGPSSFPVPLKLHEQFPRAFMLRMAGNSMNRVLPNGYFVLVDPCSTVDVSGHLFAVSIGGTDVTIRRIELHDNGFTLQPESRDPTYRAALVDYAEAEADSITVVGRVVWYCPPISWHATQF